MITVATKHDLPDWLKEGIANGIISPEGRAIAIEFLSMDRGSFEAWETATDWLSDAMDKAGLSAAESIFLEMECENC